MYNKIFFKEALKIQGYGWPVYFVLMGLINVHLNPNSDIWSLCMGLFVLVLVFNACVGLFYALLWRKWIWISVTLAVVLFVGATELVQYIIEAGWTSWGAIDELFYWNMFHNYLGVMCMSAMLAFHVKSKISDKLRRQEMARRYEREIEIRDAKIAFHTAQINPHFLCNVLTGIQRQITLNEASDAIERLANLMRYLLSVSSEGAKSVHIDKEIAGLTQYIQLECERFEECYVDYRIEGAPYELQIPPVTLITLVENAFKYGIYTDPDRPLKIYLTLVKNQLVFECCNAIDKAKKSRLSTGLGHKNIVARLDMVFPNRYSFLTEETEGKNYRVKLVINQSEINEKTEMSDCR